MSTMRLQYGSNTNRHSYVFKQVVVDETSDPLLLENTGSNTLVSVVPGTNAKVEYSISSIDDISSGRATWHEWPSGDVTETTVDSLAPGATALRLVSTGESMWEVSS